MTLSKNIRFLRLKNNMSLDELSRKMGYKVPSTVTKWESGVAEPPLKKIKEIAALFGVGINELVNTDLTNPSPPQSTKGISIPILGSIAAGIPIDAIEDIIGYEDVSHDMAASGDIYGLKVKGHSMEPRIWEDDIVILRWQSDIENGDIAAVLVNGEEVTLKKVHKNEQGITLIALNPSVYSPHFYTNQEIKDLPITIVGKVLEVRGTL